MWVLPNSHFRYSRLPDPAEPRPPRYFNILPYRESTLSDEHYGVVHDEVAEFLRLRPKDRPNFLDQPATTKQDHLLKWGMPELSPENVHLLGPFLDLLLRLDDEIDILDHKSQGNIYDDLLLAILSFWKMGATPNIDSDGNGKLAGMLLNPVIKGRPDLKEPFLKTVMAAISSQPVRPDLVMTFETFKRVRMDSIGAKIGFDIAMLFQGHCISDEERNSVSQLLEYGYLSTALSNDYYGFEREYHNHVANGTVDHIHNGIALLMKSYGYEEDEAKEIVKAEVLSAERKLIDGYKEWKDSPGPKPENLRSYMGLFILSIGGSNFWQAQSGRYHVDEPAHSKESRAGMIANPAGPFLMLTGYAHPAALVVSNKYLAPGGLSCTFPLSQYDDSRQHDERKDDDDLRSCSNYDILAPFQKSGAEDNCMIPYIYTKALPGKNTIAKFLKSLSPWFQVSDNSLDVIMEIMTMLFTSSLMLDDIEDGSHLRRGLPAAHVKFGLSQTVNSATYLFGKATALVHNNLRPGCLSVMLNELEILTLGQGMDLNWTFDNRCPTVSEYLVMIDHKTGGFFRLALQLMQTDADAQGNDNLMHLITLMGRYYQIRDDYQNLASEEYTAKKGFCDDLSEGKFSFPLIHLLQQSSNADVLRRLPIFGKEGQREEVSEETKVFILKEMKGAGSLEHTLDILNQLFDSILATLDIVEAEMGANKKLRCLILLLKL
ncbi:bifunctional terpene synthase/polyprenyl synthetase family protein [Aspergillus melleus]|uniref:bifunctional terpene synthase/polyprenyl synthetase family protein n=1 Tax=Aspergillus melleus TaxID=138277 RepID=UPI001E8CC687|nr:uncharacterized protein LDX57_010454 [Aspergillus melleus]KAH8432825.1 hypothetical protein LDX57_010454 [Aspergillus melleus]